MDRKSIKVFKGHDERILVQIMQSVTGEYEIWVREKQSNLLGGNLLKHLGKHSNLAAVRATDLAAFGRPFITNPDLPERFRNNWPLNPADDMSLWYTPGAEGYTNYQPYR